VPGSNPDYMVSARVPLHNTYTEVVGRLAPWNTSYIAAAQGNGALLLLRNILGTSTTLGTTGAGFFASGDTLSLRMEGVNISLLVNGVTRIAAADAVIASGQGAGFRNGVGSAVGTKFYDQFRVYALT
jgi:hypothetical protein